MSGNFRAKHEKTARPRSLGRGSYRNAVFSMRMVLQSTFLAQMITVFIGVCMRVFYLMGGIVAAVWVTDFFALFSAARLLNPE